MASGWWGGLTDQITSMAKDVINEGTEEVDDHATALKLEQKKSLDLTQQITVIKAENENLRKQLDEKNDSLQSVELQISTVSTEYRNILKNKEEEIKCLKRTIDELTETQKNLFSASSAATQKQSITRSHYSHFNSQPDLTRHEFSSRGGLEDDDYSSSTHNVIGFGDEEDFTEGLTHQHEINRLNMELEALRSENRHWKRQATAAAAAASTTSASSQQSESSHARRQQEEQQPDTEFEKLRNKIQVLEAKVKEEREKYEQELSVLEGLHSSKVNEIKSAHRKEIEELRDQIDSISSEKASDIPAERGARHDAEEQKRSEPNGVSSSAATSSSDDAVESTGEQRKITSDELVFKLQNALSSTQTELHKARDDLDTSLRSIAVLEQKLKETSKEKDEKLSASSKDKLASMKFMKLAMDHIKRTAKHKKAMLRSELLQLSINKDRERDDLLAQIDSLQRELDEATEHERLNKQEIESLREEYSSLNESLTELDKEHDVVVQQLINQRNELRQQNECLEEQIQSSLLSSTQPVRGGSSDEVSELKAKLEAASYTLNELHMSKAEQDDELKTLKAKLKILAEKYKDLNRSYKEVTIRAESMKNELDTLTAQLKESAGGSTVSDEQLSRLVTEKHSLEHQISSLQEELMAIQRNHASEVDQSKRRLKELEDFNRKLQNERDEQEVLLKETQTMCADLQDSLNQSAANDQENLSCMQESLDENNTRIEELTSFCNRLTEEKRRQTEELMDKSDKMDELQKILDQVMSDGENLQACLQQQRQQLQQVEGKKSELQEELTRLHQEKDDLQAELDDLMKDLEVKDQKILELEQLVKHNTKIAAEKRANERSSEVDVEPESGGMESAEEDAVVEVEGDGETAEVNTITELRTQIAELQELLAQKVLLINELQGETEAEVSSEVNDPLLMERKQSVMELQTDEPEQRQHTNEPETQSLRERIVVLEQDNKTLLSEIENLKISHNSSNSKLTERISEIMHDLGLRVREISSLEMTRAGLAKQNKQLVEELQKLQASCEESNDINASISDLKTENEKYERDNQALVELNRELISDRDLLSSKYESLELSSHQQRLSLEQEQQELKHRLDELIKANESLTTVNEELHTQISSLKSQKPSADEDLQQNLASAESRIVELKAQQVANECELTSLGVELEASRTKVTELSVALQDQTEAGSKDQDQIKELSDSIAQYETDMADLEEQLENLEEALNEKTNEIERLKRLLSAEELKTKEINEQCNSLTTEQTELKIQLTDLKNKLHSSDSERLTRPLLSPAVNSTESVADSQSVEEHMEGMTDELKQMQSELKEKDKLIGELRASNSSLKHTLSVYGDLHNLESQVRTLQTEKEQMMSILNEKTRENSQLKQEVKRLVDQVSSARSQQQQQQQMSLDNGSGISQMGRMDRIDMHKEAMQKLSSLVRDKEMEIEALTQKNKSLLAVLQQQSPSTGEDHGEQVSKIIEEKQLLSQQVAQYANEREQLYNALQTKHQEAVGYHAEVMRLSQLLQQSNQHQTTEAASQQELQKLREDYASRKQQLIDVQAQLHQYKQKCAELTNQLETSSSSDATVPLALYESLQQEASTLKVRLSHQKEALLEKDKSYEDIQQRVTSQEESHSLLKTECTNLRKQIENLTFELSSARTENDDYKLSYNKLKEQMKEKEVLVKSLRNKELQAQQRLNETAAELLHKSSQINSSHQSADSVKEQLEQTIMTLTSERNAAHLVSQQHCQALEDVRRELSEVKDNEAKLHKELDRLRSHLVQIEESYTIDALESEEREKELRNRLAVAEEKAAHTSTAVQQASIEAAKHVTALEEQLHLVSASRDEAMMQLSSSQEECQQYQTELDNLQLVLEQFQSEKDSIHTAELNRLSSQISAKSSEISSLQQELATVRVQLTEQEEALEAAQRLSHQLEKKELAMNALRDEVNLREENLREAEDKIRSLTLNSDSKIDKQLIKNLVLNYFSTHKDKQMEVLHLIARVLNFTDSDNQKVGLAGQSGWIGGLWSRFSQPSSSPNANQLDQSFSELFVKFLETESAPKPKPLPLPVDQMVEEERKKAELHQRAAFNPFIAPTSEPATSTPARSLQASSSSTVSHPLLIGVQKRSSPLLPAATVSSNSLTSVVNIRPQSTQQPVISQGLQSSTTPVLINETLRFVPITKTNTE